MIFILFWFLSLSHPVCEKHDQEWYQEHARIPANTVWFTGQTYEEWYLLTHKP